MVIYPDIFTAIYFIPSGLSFNMDYDNALNDRLHALNAIRNYSLFCMLSATQVKSNDSYMDITLEKWGTIISGDSYIYRVYVGIDKVRVKNWVHDDDDFNSLVINNNYDVSELSVVPDAKDLCTILKNLNFD